LTAGLSGEAATGRSARAHLVFASGGGRTILVRQFVPYPFHVTRPFHLDREQPGLATLYLQSASGGLYRGDDLGLAISVGSGAGAHVTTQSATIVHDTKLVPAQQHVDIAVSDDGFLAYTPDPLVLFPGAGACNDTRIVVGARSRVIVIEGFAWHDPEGRGRPFNLLSQRLAVGDAHGRCLAQDVGHLGGRDFLSAASPLGPYRAAATMLILAPAAAQPDDVRLQQCADMPGCLGGVSTLPNGVGKIVRCLARDGGALRASLAALFDEAFRALVGVAPATRPK